MEKCFEGDKLGFCCSKTTVCRAVNISFGEQTADSTRLLNYGALLNKRCDCRGFEEMQIMWKSSNISGAVRIETDTLIKWKSYFLHSQILHLSFLLLVSQDYQFHKSFSDFWGEFFTNIFKWENSCFYDLNFIDLALRKKIILNLHKSLWTHKSLWNMCPKDLQNIS